MPPGAVARIWRDRLTLLLAAAVHVAVFAGFYAWSEVLSERGGPLTDRLAGGVGRLSFLAWLVVFRPHAPALVADITACNGPVEQWLGSPWGFLFDGLVLWAAWEFWARRTPVAPHGQAGRWSRVGLLLATVALVHWAIYLVVLLLCTVGVTRPDRAGRRVPHLVSSAGRALARTVLWTGAILDGIGLLLLRRTRQAIDDRDARRRFLGLACLVVGGVVLVLGLRDVVWALTATPWTPALGH